MKTVYRITEKEIKAEDSTCYITYGIAAFYDKSDVPFRTVDDVFTSRDDANALIALCNRLELAAGQLDDVLYDSLSSY